MLTLVPIKETATREEIKEMREWLIDCYPDQEDEIDNACDETIMKNVERDFCGGLEGFLENERMTMRGVI